MKMRRKDFFYQSAALFAPGFGSLSNQAGPSGRWTDVSSVAMPIVSVRQYGAKADGMVKDTHAIQAAIDEAGKRGGLVYFPAGNYLSGTVRLKSFVTLHLAAGAVLIASPDNSDFDPHEKLGYNSYSDPETTYFHYALIRGEDVHDIAITGQGTIDGNRTRRGGPKPIAFKRCHQISIRDITMRNAPNYNISLLGCDYVDIEGVTIFNGFADGIDPDCCHDVRIANCYIESWDDAIVPKTSPSLGYIRSTENVTVTNCVLTTACYGLKLGTESSGDFKNIAFSNCTVFSSREKYGRGPIAGLAIESVDGAKINRVVATNITVGDARAALFIRLGNRGRGQTIPTPGTLANVSLSNIVATGSSIASSITGIPGHDAADIALENIRISALGGGSAAKLIREVPEVIAAYPEADMFGELPAYGLYCRHASNLTLNGLHFQLESADERPAIVADDAKQLDLISLRPAPCSGDQPVILLHNVSGAFLQGSRALPGTRVFLKASGNRTQKIHAIGNDLSEATVPFDVSEEVPKDGFAEIGNLLPTAHAS